MQGRRGDLIYIESMLGRRGDLIYIALGMMLVEEVILFILF